MLNGQLGQQGMGQQSYLRSAGQDPNSASLGWTRARDLAGHGVDLTRQMDEGRAGAQQNLFNMWNQYGQTYRTPPHQGWGSKLLGTAASLYGGGAFGGGGQGGGQQQQWGQQPWQSGFQPQGGQWTPQQTGQAAGGSMMNYLPW